jgi:WD40 repeat protein/mono/diheme cytochrome c family protein
MYPSRRLALLGGLLLALLVRTPPGSPAAAPPPSLATRAAAVLRTHCAACHGGRGWGGFKGGFAHVLDRDRLVGRGQVVPGNADASPLYQRVRDGEMPPPRKGVSPTFTAADRDLLQRWIAAGAPGPAATAVALLDEPAVQRLVAADLEKRPPRQRRFVRYLSLAHLAARPAGEVQAARQALARLVNSLSWHPRLTLPQPVDPGRLLFRIDLRDYRWSARAWDRLAANYPYRLPEVAAEQLVLRADWFLATASRPPFYPDFLQLPTTDKNLERLLQVDVAANLQDDNAVRAGFNGSGVARHNRLLERHDGAWGAYWRSYDFNEGTGRQNLFERPLGPAPGPAGFRQAGGEAIFDLPNGLHAYLLFDGDGKRVDKAPGDIVSDPKRPDKLVENGLSCIGCHTAGLIPKDDQVRPHVLKNARAFNRETRDAVLALYAPAARTRALLDADNTRFLAALAKLGITPGDPEPVSTAVLRYEAVLDVQTAAAEVSQSPAQLAAALRQDEELGRALGALLARGGTVQRQVWEEAFPKLAKVLRLGAVRPTPVAGAFHGHKGAVRALAWAPDGRTAASAGDEAVYVWDAATGRLRWRLEGHSGAVSALAFSADGRRLLSAGADRVVRLWDTGDGKLLLRLVGHTEPVRAVAFTPDGRRALSAGEDRCIRLWDLRTSRELDALTGHAGTITALAVSADGKRMLSAGTDRSLRLWDLGSGADLGNLTGHTGEVHAVAFAPDGRHAASGGADRTLRVWDVAKKQLLATIRDHPSTVVSVAFSADGRRAWSASTRGDAGDRPVRGWDLVARRATAGPDPGRVEVAALGRDGRLLFSPADGELRLTNLR